MLLTPRDVFPTKHVSGNTSDHCFGNRQQGKSCLPHSAANLGVNYLVRKI